MTSVIEGRNICPNRVARDGFGARDQRAGVIDGGCVERYSAKRWNRHVHVKTPIA
jgi:hypothetical protein